MRTWTRGILALASLTLGLAASAHAATLTTSSLQAGVTANNEGVACEAVNVGKKPLAVTISFVNVDGQITQPGTEQVLEPGAVRGESFSSDFGFTVHCRITFAGPKKSVLGSLRLRDANFNTIAVVPAR